MIGVVLAAAAGAGTYLVFTACALGRRDLPGLPERMAADARYLRERLSVRLREPLVRAGLSDVRVAELLGASLVVGIVAGLVGLVLFGAVVPALAVACAVAIGWPVASFRLRCESVRAHAQEAWPAMLEEMRVLTSNMGLSVPQALFEAGQRAPDCMQAAFVEAQREWLLSTDLERTFAVLKEGLADPTADAACETLLVAHQLGGSDLGRRLQALIEDRSLDVQNRKDARARQAGVRFARRFVLLVPAGMALVGLTIGNGRAAYGTVWGQAMVLLGIVVIAGCWAWAGRLLRLPVEERVFR